MNNYDLSSKVQKQTHHKNPLKEINLIIHKLLIRFFGWTRDFKVIMYLVKQSSYTFRIYLLPDYKT